MTINGTQITVREGSTVLQAAKAAGNEIPTMCYLERCGPITSCMVCVVHDLASGRLIPACSMPAAEGMRIETENERVQKARKDTLDLLLSEHVGNCEGPCQRACPAYMNIPLMIRQIKEERFAEALKTVKQNIALPAVLGRICPAPCEKGCNRKYHDGALSICHLKRFVADVDLAGANSYLPEIKNPTGKRVAIVGAGPAGLAAAYYLQPEGHACDVYDDHELPGGLLRYGIPDERYDKRVLDDEIESIRRLGVVLKMKTRLGQDISLDELRRVYDAVILTTGQAETEDQRIAGPNYMARGMLVDKKTFETSIPAVFAGGNILAEGRMAIRSLAHGRFIADAVHQYLSGLPVTGYQRRFNSVIGRLMPGEGEQFVQLASGYLPVDALINPDGGFSPQEAVRESTRCFRCDCRKKESCKLRKYSDSIAAISSVLKPGTGGGFNSMSSTRWCFLSRVNV